MIVQSSLLLKETGDTESILNSFWNNLVRTMTIMNGGTRLPSTLDVSSAYLPLVHKTYNLDLRLYNYSSWVIVGFVYDDNLEEILDTAVAMTSALEYVIGRTECLDIENWKVFYGNTEKENQDVGVDSMADVLGVSKEDATALFEERVEPKLDKIEEVCL